MNKNIISAASIALSLLFTSATIQAKEYQIVNVVKVSGIPWFNQMKKGVEQAGEDLGVNVRQLGPATPDPAQQVKIIEDLIAQGVDAITIVPNDIKVLEPVIKKARDKGIVVITNEAPGNSSSNWDVETIDNTAYAHDTMDALAKAMGNKGGYVIYVGSLTVPLHNTWADLAAAYQKKTYPDMYQVTSRMPVAESIDKSFSATNDLMRAHSDLKGVISYGSLGGIGAAETVKKKRAKNKMSIVGIMMPSQAAPYLMRGEIDKGFLWNPADAGYGVISVAKAILDGKNIDNGITVKGLGEADVDVNKRVIKFNKILVVTKENAVKLGF